MSIFNEDIIIAIDGYSSCGKSTFAKSLAEKLAYLYIDSGAMYRAVTLVFLNEGLISNEKIDKHKFSEVLKKIEISFINNETYLNGRKIENDIRSIEVANSVSTVSKIREVRNKLVTIQREIGRNKRVVMDGRDIGSIVFPEAEIKIFMIADVNIRAERRYKELKIKDEKINFSEVRENLIKRDYIDIHRKESPLVKAEDAIILDNSSLTPEEQLKWGLDLINTKFLAKLK